MNMKPSAFQIFENNTGMSVGDFFKAFAEMVASGMRPGESEAGDHDEDPRGPIYDYGENVDDPFMAAHAMEDSYNCDEMFLEPEEEMVDNEFPINSGQAEMFPGRKTFNMNDLNPDDGSFYRGREIGIPLRLAVRVSSEQGLQLPMARGPAVRG